MLELGGGGGLDSGAPCFSGGLGADIAVLSNPNPPNKSTYGTA